MSFHRFVRHNLHLDRYNNTVGRYKMLDHDRDQTNPEAARTYGQLITMPKSKINNNYNGLLLSHHSMTTKINKY